MNVSEQVLPSYFIALLTYWVLSIIQTYYISDSAMLQNNCVRMSAICNENFIIASEISH
jgi:hypothetical protein